ncbi:bifunctional demethylmenaquinone methyltransferase/2-methoxy-6-polyprenyl-1,4-benzoquinol methylase UbiE [Chitinophaga nivalis]|uniref:Demethylmenaquinone methyltransferase n=1 Tax=Chitinophaga nivalis TaxID=2991709 RepID=A0ABT3IT12_9BACT|nr:bifunctional demethylmenaquinone methyltransferase/2-methoxy-6-polyprenyl-1,4-benzoquinol methylase UbiE [Chitinophaga nivalis]MCW3463192.1 bifunctional demethylmenaquinone methyltransferase/2-methoxy-6-polyprenyl-1,4-benzoquinol methylase UbiE [Chitinophaga nivalis]MCW3487118.1 bifunctional demethylmenaquinone methyltransferase/2-methoxy-6-polyprenyl-1,4-benzoquinol methylase UbiE [Chitinophaga nivalis]
MSENINVQKIVPFEGSKLSKKEQIATIFNDIAYRYDFLNHFMSLGIDIIWRKKALKQLRSLQPKYMLDVATGTGDFAIMAEKKLHPEKIVGIDISAGMLEHGRQKIEKLGLGHKITLELGDSETISFPDQTFDAITVAFGVRNFENLEKGLAEMRRVLKPGGKLVILEFSNPTVFPIKQLYNLYSSYLIPLFGKWIAKSQAAYSYLPESVKAFPQGEAMKTILTNIGFQAVTCKTLTFGICSIYCATR